MLFNKLFVFRDLDKPVPSDASQNGMEVKRDVPRLTHDSKILQEEAGAGLVVSEAFGTPEAIMGALFPNHKENEIREIMGAKYNVLLGVLKGRLEGLKQRFLGFKVEHNDVLVIWQRDNERQVMSLKSVCGIELNDIAAFIGEETQALLGRVEGLMKRMEKWVKASRFLLSAGFEQSEVEELLADGGNPYLFWLLKLIDGMPGNGFEYGISQSKYILAFRKLPRERGKKEVLYRQKYVDLALNWKKLIFPALEKIAKGYNFENDVLPLIIAKDPFLESIMMDIIEGFPLSAESRRMMRRNFNINRGQYVSREGKARTQIEDDGDDSFPQDKDEGSDILLVDPELQKLNYERKEFVESKIVDGMTPKAVEEVRSKLSVYLAEIAKKEPILGDVHARFSFVLPDIEKYIQKEVKKGATALDILFSNDFDRFMTEKWPEFNKLDDSKLNSKEVIKLYFDTFFYLMYLQLVAAGAKGTSELLEMLKFLKSFSI